MEDEEPRDTLPATMVAFGFAGLIPPVAAAAMLVLLPPGTARDLAWVALLLYASIILSFLGGTWWAYVARRPGAGWLAMAVAPSLIAVTLLMLTLDAELRRGAAALLGVAILLSPVADRTLDSVGLVPSWWMRLRVPLSIGLALCVAVGAWRVPAG